MLISTPAPGNTCVQVLANRAGSNSGRGAPAAGAAYAVAKSSAIVIVVPFRSTPGGQDPWLHYLLTRMRGEERSFVELGQVAAY